MCQFISKELSQMSVRSIKGSSRKSSPKEPRSELQLSTKDLSQKDSWKHRKKKFDRSLVLKKKDSWKYWKKKSIFDRRLVQKEIVSWKYQKKEFILN